MQKLHACKVHPFSEDGYHGFRGKISKLVEDIQKVGFDCEVFEGHRCSPFSSPPFKTLDRFLELRTFKLTEPQIRHLKSQADKLS